jgi:hypothetical protein
MIEITDIDEPLYLRAVQATLCEWETPEDAAAFEDL